LRENSCCCFGSWKIANVAQTKHILKLVVLESSDIDVQPAILMGQLAFSDEIWRRLRWCNM
jgi:hypothetical protein